MAGGKCRRKRGQRASERSTADILMGGVVLQHDVDTGAVGLGGLDYLFDRVREADELLVTVVGSAPPTHLTRLGHYGRKHDLRIVQIATVGTTLGLTQTQRQQRMCANRRLHLALLVPADDHRVLWPAKVQRHDVAAPPMHCGFGLSTGT